MLRGQARRVRPQRRLDRPVHDRRLGQASTSRAAASSSRRAASTARRSTEPRPQPELRREDRLEGAGRTSRTSSSSSSTRTRTTSTNKVEAGEYDTATDERPAAVPAEVLDGLEPEAVLPPELRRPHLVPDDEPDAAAVRRRPRAPGDELGHGQARARPGVGRPGHRRRSRTTSSRTRCSTTSSPTTRRTRRPATRQRREGEGRDEGVEVRHRQERHVRRQGVQERAHDRRTPARSTPKMLAGDRSRARRRSASRFKVRTVKGAYPTIQTPSKNIPIAERPGWGKDYADPYTFFGPLFDGRDDHPERQHELLARRHHAGDAPRRSASRATCTNVPSVNADLDKCANLVGAAHIACYAALDKKLMTQVVPWVPYLWSNGDPHHRARTSRSRSSTSSRRRPPTHTWRSSRNELIRRSPGRPHGAPRTRSPDAHDADLHRTPPRLDGRRHPRRAASITFLVFFKLPAGDPALRFAGKSPTTESLALIRQRLTSTSRSTSSSATSSRTSSRATRTAGPASATPTAGSCRSRTRSSSGRRGRSG